MEGYFKLEKLMKFVVVLCLLVKRCYTACNNPLGMEDGRIGDAQITANNWLYSSQNFNAYYRPKYARLNNQKFGGGGWCSENIEDYAGAFVEIDLLKNTKITGIGSQGRGIGSEFIDEFGMTYMRDNETAFREYKENGRWHVFTANNDTITVVKNQLKSPVIARRIRIVPHGDTFSIYCGRFEIYGCTWKKQQDHLKSYLLPLADKISEQDTRDYTYDGVINKQLFFRAGGLGKLVDDEYGSEIVDESSLAKWIAYKKRDKFMPFFQFEFAVQRRFSAVKFHMVNKESRIEVFSQVKILFSDDGTKFEKELVYLTTAAERHSSSAFIITVPIPDVTTRHVKCIFTQTAQWMLFSEVDFTSVSPDAPLPTRPVEQTKKVETQTTAADIRTEKPMFPSTIAVKTSRKRTPRLFFSLPDEITNMDIFKLPTKTTVKVESEAPISNSNYDIDTGAAPKSSSSQGSLSFPIIIAIVLGAIVISAIMAVLIFRQIRRMGKDSGHSGGAHEKVARPAMQSPEFHELLISERHLPPPILLKGKILSDASGKLIMDSGYTSHGSAGGSVKDMPVRANAGSPV